MCGIFGYITSDNFKNIVDKTKFIQQAFVAGSLRGEDASGIFGISDKTANNPKQDFCYKKNLSGWDFVNLKYVDKLIEGLAGYKYVVGHNRLATKGGVSTDAAHPYTIDHITLVHNGTLSFYGQMVPKKSYYDYITDSEAIAHSLAYHEDPIEALEKLEGAYALVWYNKLTDKLYLTRNEDRPLYVASVKDNEFLPFASEKLMLLWLLARNKFSVEKIYDLTPGVLYSLDSGVEGAWEKTSYKIKKYIPANTYNKGTTRHTYSTTPHPAPTPINIRHKLSRNQLRKVLKKWGISIKQRVNFSLASFESGMGFNAPIKKICRGYINKTPLRIIGEVEKDQFDLAGIYNGIIINATSDKPYPETIKNPSAADIILRMADIRLAGIDPGEDWDIEEEDEEDLTIPPNKVIQLHNEDEARFDYVPGPGGIFVHIEAWKAAAKDGCCICSDVLYPEDASKIRWTLRQPYNPVCPKCVDIYYNSKLKPQVSNDKLYLPELV